MLIPDAQREMRTVFLGNFAGTLMSGVIWALAAGAGLMEPRYGIIVLFFGSFFSFLLARVILRAMGRSATLSRNNALAQLAPQIAFTVPISFLVVLAATLYKENWFFPASMIVVGAHYLPFIFLYGMWHFGVLAGILVVGGLGLGLYGPDTFTLGGWLSALVFFIFAFVLRSAVLREESQPAGTAAGHA